MPGAARRPGAACATSSIAASTPMPTGRRVFDGVLPHVAGAGRKWLNHRFASPIVSGGQQYEDHFNIADSFPFSYAWSTDHLTGKQDAILKRPDTDPLVFHTQTATEYWVRRGSLAHTDTRATTCAQPDTVRVYCWASSQHFADPQPKPPSRGHGQNFSNVVSTSMFFRANLDAMDRWATDGTPPPPSRIPTRADGTLVSIEEWRRQFPAIPGVATPHSPNVLPLLDFGPDVERGILREPPHPVPGGNAPDAPGKQYTVLVPRWIATATTCPACAHRWWPHRSAPTPVGICARAATATGRNCASRAATSRSPKSPQERADHRRPSPLDPGAISRQGGLCRGDHRGRARTRGAGTDAGRGCRALRRGRRGLGTAAARRGAGVETGRNDGFRYTLNPSYGLAQTGVGWVERTRNPSSPARPSVRVQVSQERDQRLIHLGRALLLRPVAAARQHDRLAQQRHGVRHVRDESPARRETPSSDRDRRSCTAPAPSPGHRQTAPSVPSCGRCCDTSSGRHEIRCARTRRHRNRHPPR